MPSRLILSIVESIKVIRDLLRGRTRSDLQAEFKMNSRDLRQLVYICFPGYEGRILGQTLAADEQRSINVFLSDVERLEQAYQTARTGPRPFVVEARKELLALFQSNAYPDSGFSQKLAFYCLSDWNGLRESLGDTERALLAPVFDLSAEETCELIEFLERLADYYVTGQGSRQYLCEMKKIRAFQLVSKNKIREATTCFSDALPLARHAYSGPQATYLEFFYHILAHRADWLDLNLPEARSHLEKATRVIDAEKAQRVLNGYYWGVDDLQRDKILLNATEAALSGDANKALEEVERWLRKSVHLSYTSPRYNHLKIVSLSLKWIITPIIERGGIKTEIMAQIASSDLRRRADLYFLHVLDLMRVRNISSNEATVEVGKLLSPDAFPPADTEDITKELSQQLAPLVQAPQFLPKWLVEWAKERTEKGDWRQAYALEVYAVCIAEFFSAIANAPRANYKIATQSRLWRGLDWAIHTLEGVDLTSLRKGEQLKVLTQLLHGFEKPWAQSETGQGSCPKGKSSVWEIIEQTATDLFPHLTYLPQRQVCLSTGDGILLERLWPKDVKTLLILSRTYPREAGYYYLSPWLNYYEQDTYQPDPYEEVTLIRAELYGEPSAKPVATICDGATDKAAFEILLDHLYPQWKVLEMKLLNGRGVGKTLDAVEHVMQLGGLFVVIQDSDAQPFFKKQATQKEWTEVVSAIERAPHAYLDPDIEGVSVRALVAAIKEANPTAVFDEQVVSKELEQYATEVASGKRGKYSGGTLAYAKWLITEKYWHSGPSLRGVTKGEDWGKALARKMVETGIPTQVADALGLCLGIARGLKLAPA